MTKQLNAYNHFRLMKTWDNRVKFTTPVLKGEPERAYIFQILLNKRSEIKEMSITVQTGEVDITFDVEHLPTKNLLTVVDAILSNVARKNCQNIEKNLLGHPETIKLMVEGMRCPACALLIEMSLKKDPRIVDVSANLDTKSVRVFGAIDKQLLIEKIEQLGYRYVAASAASNSSS